MITVANFHKFILFPSVYIIFLHLLSMLGSRFPLILPCSMGWIRLSVCAKKLFQEFILHVRMIEVGTFSKWGILAGFWFIVKLASGRIKIALQGLLDSQNKKIL